MKEKTLLIILLLWGSLIKAQIPSDLPKSGLQAFWPFSGNTHDISGNKHHAKAYGVSLAKDRFGNENNAYYFDGISDFITTNYKGVVGNHARAISLWANVSRFKAGQTLVTWGDNDQFPNSGGRFDCCFGGCFLCKPGDDFVGATIEIADAGITYEGHAPVTDGEWHHYVFQFNGKYIKDVEIYQDGRLLTHEPDRFYENTPINTRPDINVTIGALFLPTDTISYIKGYIDDVAIYDRALNDEEIKALYLAPDPNKKINILKWFFLLLLVVSFVLIVIWLIRWRVKKLVSKEKEKIQVEKKWFEQENRVLKAQMDPHFIFNSLNSIQQFIIVNDNEKAQLYLSTFAQLIRKQLESNTNENITLKQEVEILEKYLEIESLRFNNAFDHEIIISKDLDTGSIYIPYFLIQPFVENAIHHGLLPKIGYKELTITIEIQDQKTLKCTIEDNGIGRKKSELKEMPFKTKSLGVNFVQQRLRIMSKIENRKYGVEIIDKENEDGTGIGTLAILTMPIQTKV